MTMTNMWMQLLHMLRLLWPSQQRACIGYYVMHSAGATNNHKLHPLAEKKSAWAALTIFCTVEPVTYKIAVFILLLIFCRFQSEFFRTSAGKFNHDFNHEFLHSGTPTLKGCSTVQKIGRAAQADFLGKSPKRVELMNIYVARVLCMT